MTTTITPSQYHPTLGSLTVGDAMHHGVVTCRRDLSLRGIARVMAGHRVHCVIVTDDENGRDIVWGVVSDLDLVAAAYARDLEDQTADGSAATPVVLVSPGESLERAAQLMTENAVSHLVVVDPVTGRPIGVLSTLDLAEALSA
ncbi:MAG TPA: CBS domain-containing protein [Gaiellaceae bacterium]|jgi:CBS domain-containing protein|nr:CBS domain-containing protein [Gaiellaceae bacterium]